MTTTFPARAYEFTPSKRISATEIIRVEAGLHYLQGNSRPHFSVTATVTDSSRPGRDKFDRGGCLHEEIAQHFPALKPVIALHLSDDTGAPMHATANGWYWLAGYWGDTGEAYTGATGPSAKTPDECLAVFADHVRVSLADARSVAFRLKTNADPKSRRLAFGEWIDAQGKRWAQEALEATKLLVSLGAL